MGIWAAKRELLSLRIDEKNATLHQLASQASAAMSAEVRDTLSKFGVALQAVAERPHTDEIKRRKAELHSSVGRLQEGLGELHAASRERHESSLAAMARSQERHEERLDELATQVAAIAKKLGIESEDAKPKDHRNPDFMRRRSMV